MSDPWFDPVGGRVIPPPKHVVPYLYRCANGHKWIQAFEMGTAPDALLVECFELMDGPCPDGVCKCGLTLKRVYTAPGLVFKGNGWGGKK